MAPNHRWRNAAGWRFQVVRKGSKFNAYVSDLMTTTMMIFDVVVPRYNRHEARARVMFKCHSHHPLPSRPRGRSPVFLAPSPLTPRATEAFLEPFSESSGWASMLASHYRKMKKYLGEEPPEDKILDPFWTRPVQRFHRDSCNSLNKIYDDSIINGPKLSW